MKNNSNVAILFNITLDSSNRANLKECEQKRFTNFNDFSFKPLIGPCNFNGQGSFDVFPIQGTIQAGKPINYQKINNKNSNSFNYTKITATSHSKINFFIMFCKQRLINNFTFQLRK
jgi:hypothetical protein